MDAAIAELKRTILAANEYLKSAMHHPEELRSHADALQEDCDAVNKLRTAENAEIADAANREARRAKRDLERLYFPLIRARDEQLLLLRKEELAVQKKATEATMASLDKAPPVKRTSAVKLPTIKLPVFSGEVEQWRGFKQMLTDLLDEDVDMASAKKWLLLKEHLTGQALQIVQELPTSPETYRIAMDLLEQTYGSVNKAVTSLYVRLQALQPTDMSGANLRLMHAKLDGMLRSLELLGEDVVANRFLRTIVVYKFPSQIHLALKVTDDMDLPKFRKKVAGYIATNHNSLEMFEKTKSTNETTIASGTTCTNTSKNRFWRKSGTERSAPADAKSSASSAPSAPSDAPPAKKPASTRPKRCSFCEAEHYSDQCDAYKTVEQRKQKLGLRCQVCFRQPHPGKECSRIIKCAYCNEVTHNRALCPKRSVERACPVRDDPAPSVPAAPAEATCAVRDQASQNTALTPTETETVLQEVANAEYVTFMVETFPTLSAKTGENVRAVVDTASRRTLISRNLVDQLHLHINEENAVQLYGVSNVTASTKPNPTCRLYLRPPNQEAIVIEAVIVDRIIDNITAPSVAEFRRRFPKYDHLHMPDEGNGNEVQLLIGTRSLLPILTLHNSIPVNSSIQLLSTKFGWVILGGYDESVKEESSSVATMIIQNYDPVKLMCDLEIVGLKGLEQTHDEEEAIALDKFYSSLKFEEDEKRYEMGLPLRYEPVDLADNFGLAWGRLKSLYKKLSSTPDLLTTYNEQIQQQNASRIIEKVDRTVPTTNAVHYIAHQLVVKVDTSTPARIVLDASAHLPGQRSLNDNILKGASWVDDMPSLLIRFRKEEVGVIADVSKAFHQLSIRQEDRDLCRFIWLIDVTKPPTSDNLQIYRFRRVAFGLASSPFLLYATIKHHIRLHPHQFTEILEKDIYADNLVTSVPASTDLLELYTKIKGTFSSMSMDLTKWSSNSTTLLSHIPKEHQLPERVHSVLGLLWDTKADRMSLPYKGGTFATLKLTKRRVLAESASVFDPLGWAMPVIILARIFIRKIWALDYTWDQTLPQELTEEWLQIRESLRNVHRISLPRNYFTHPAFRGETDLELHIFSDASIEAYALVVFLRSNRQVSFVAAKARLSPKTKLSIPRLELLAALMASRYAAYVSAALKTENQPKVTLWSDSKCILSWLQTTKILPAFVQKTVAEIKASPVTSFHYVPSEKNPADIVSRGATLVALQETNWWQGPLWLRDEADWPKQDCEEQKKAENIALRVNAEEKSLLVKTNIAVNKFDPKKYESSPFTLDPKKFLNFESLLKRSSYVLHAVNRIFQRSKLAVKPIPVENAIQNYNFVRIIWLKWDQRRAYQEIPFTRRSNVAYLRNISVFKDEDGLLRCTTRLQNSAESIETIQPILLVKDSPITVLIVMSLHVNNLHAGTAHTLAALRRSYWLPHGRQQVFKIVSAFCSTCRIHRAKPFAMPDMAPLPQFRINKTETPFRNVGVDTFGPISCKNPKNPKEKKKRNVMILTCMITRAVHLEVLDDMTSVEFLRAFRCFVARRGTPAIIVSDNAPQFGVVERRFVDVWRYFSEKEDVVNYCAKSGIQWKFIPPHSPWMGGVYERLIKSVKIAFEKTHRDVSLTTKQLRTIVVEIEAMLNSRPISYVDRSLETPIITPNHFLQVRYPSIPVKFDEENTSEINQLWKAAEQYLNTYWRHWSYYYVRSMRERVDDMRNPHGSTAKQPQVGEVVLMVDPGTRRSNWIVAIVERLVYSDDKKVRAAQIYKIDGGRMVRPINTLLPLNIITDLPDVKRMELNAARTGLVHQLGESDDENIDDELQPQEES